MLQAHRAFVRHSHVKSHTLKCVNGTPPCRPSYRYGCNKVAEPYANGGARIKEIPGLVPEVHTLVEVELFVELKRTRSLSASTLTAVSSLL